MALNKYRNRMGSLFMKPYKKKHVESEDYLTRLIFYIHLNPVHHGFTKSFESYKWSSYHSIIGKEKNILDLEVEEVIGWFGGIEGMKSAHNTNSKWYGNREYTLE